MTRIYKIEVYRPVGAMDIEHDWCAIDDLTYCGESTDPIGYGRTPRDAVEDLMDQIDQMHEEWVNPFTGEKTPEKIVLPGK